MRVAAGPGLLTENSRACARASHRTLESTILFRYIDAGLSVGDNKFHKIAKVLQKNLVFHQIQDILRLISYPSPKENRRK